MNLLEFLKKGSGIHIKKENRGKFTDYCGGKVTSECIARGKASSNPAIRKRATFAANARKWKHKKGGRAFVPGASITDSRPEAYWEIKKKKKTEWLEKKQLGGTVINESPIVANHFNWMNNAANYLAQKKQMEEQKRALELQKQQQTTDMINNIANSVVNLGTQYFANKALNKNGTPSAT